MEDFQCSKKLRDENSGWKKTQVWAQNLENFFVSELQKKLCRGELSCKKATEWQLK